MICFLRVSWIPADVDQNYFYCWHQMIWNNFWRTGIGVIVVVKSGQIPGFEWRDCVWYGILPLTTKKYPIKLRALIRYWVVFKSCVKSLHNTMQSSPCVNIFRSHHHLCAMSTVPMMLTARNSDAINFIERNDSFGVSQVDANKSHKMVLLP